MDSEIMKCYCLFINKVYTLSYPRGEDMATTRVVGLGESVSGVWTRAAHEQPANLTLVGSARALLLYSAKCHFWGTCSGPVAGPFALGFSQESPETDRQTDRWCSGDRGQGEAQ